MAKPDADRSVYGFTARQKNCGKLGLGRRSFDFALHCHESYNLWLSHLTLLIKGREQCRIEEGTNNCL